MGRGFTMQLNFSYTQRTRDKVFPEIIAYYNEMIPKWIGPGRPDPNTGKFDPSTAIDSTGKLNLGMAGLPNPADGNRPYKVTLFEANDAGQKIPYTMPLWDYVWEQIYGTDPATGQPIALPLTSDQANLTSLRDGLENQLWRQSGALGSRPFKGNVTLRYSFRAWQNRWLKGLSVGATYRYNGYSLVRAGVDKTTDITAGNALGLDPGAFSSARVMRHGKSTNNMSSFITYRTKLSFLGINTDARFQLNVNNMFNSSLITVGEYNIYGAPIRIYQSSPRSFQFTAEFNF